MKKMHFNEYLALHEDKYKEMLNIKKNDRRKSGEILEELTFKLFQEFGYKADKHNERVDIMFGADIKLAWVGEDGWNYSLHLDVTGRKKDQVHWLDYEGTHKNKHSFYGGENFSAYYGLKKFHPTGFKYQTSVYVMRIENKWSHNTAIYQQEFQFAIENLKRLHMESERPKRASMMIHVPEYLLQGGVQS